MACFFKLLLSLFPYYARIAKERPFSIGSVTYNKPPKFVDEMVKLGDRAIYSIKTSTKNGVAYRLYAG
jgi:hypothetical protein